MTTAVERGGEAASMPSDGRVPGVPGEVGILVFVGLDTGT